MSTDAPHSELYFTDARDHWWNADYLALLATRFGLGAARRVLDVGAGQGHFARAWAPHLAPDAEIVCLDPEARSLAIAREKCAAFTAARGLRTAFSFVEGRVESIPFEDERFDLVMCQTVLIHVPDPAVAMREMIRVTARDGCVLASEPNNLASAQRVAAFGPDVDPEIAMRQVRLHARCMNGKARLGEGWNNLGVWLPRYFAPLADVRFYQCDRPWVLAPPYADAQQRAAIDDLRDHVARGVWGWHREDARRYFVAGGGDAAAFDREYDLALADQRDELARVEAGAHCELTAVAMLIAGGRKR